MILRIVNKPGKFISKKKIYTVANLDFLIFNLPHHWLIRDSIAILINPPNDSQQRYNKAIDRKSKLRDLKYFR